MTAARLTAAEARRLGIDAPARSTRNRSVARAPYHTVCVLDGEHFHTQAAEDRHLNETGHPRYALVLS